MAAVNKVPGVRFKGFSGEWEEVELGDNADFSKGRGYSKSDLVSVGSPVILYGRLYTQYQTVISDVDTFVIETNNSILSKGSEVIVPASGETADDISRASAILQSGVLLGGDLNIVYPSDKLDSIFLALTISNGKPQKDLSRKAQGKSVVHVRNNDLKKVDITYPNINEQTKIGNYFQQLDNLINQHQQKHNKLLNVKKAMLDKMFPQQGENVPEIRFKGFSGEWRKKEFSDNFLDIHNNTLSRANLNYNFGLARNVHYGDILIKFGEILDVKTANIPFITDNNLVAKLKTTNLQDGDVIIADAAEDRTVGKCTEIVNVENTVVFSGLHTIAVRPKWSFSPNYLGYFMNSFAYHNQLLALMQGTKVLSVSKSAIRNTSIVFPVNPNEQAKIGNFFKQLDTLINQHETQLTKLNNIKQACLSKMFV